MALFESNRHDDISAAAQLPKYFEIVPPDHYKLLKAHSPTHRFFTKAYGGKPIESHLLPVSEAMYEDHPITCPGYPVLREDLFEAILPYLNKTYFGIKPFKFDD
jgi:hypothetical protein